MEGEESASAGPLVLFGPGCMNQGMATLLGTEGLCDVRRISFLSELQYPCLYSRQTRF